MDRQKPVSSLHYRYVIFMLLSVSVFLMTDRWTEKGDFTQYLSNAATMTSLLLGVVAIFYSFISNSNMSNSLGSITEVSKDVKEVGDQIAKYHGSSGELIAAGTKSIQAFEGVSKDITGNLRDFHSLLKDMDSKNLEMRSLIGSFPSKFEQLENTFNKVAEQVQKQKPSPEQTKLLANWNIKRFVKRSSHHENLITYACILHAEHKKRLNVRDFCQSAELPGHVSLNSFIRCLDSAGLLSLVTASQDPGFEYRVSLASAVKSSEYEKEMLEDSKISTYREIEVDLPQALKVIKDLVTDTNEGGQ